jgi:hypothetical protein
LRDFSILIALGAFMAAIGAFDTDGASLARRLVYWPTLMIAGGVVHATFNGALRRTTFVGSVWKRGALLAVLMTVPLTPLVWIASASVFGAELSLRRLAELVPGVLLVCAAVVGLLGVTQPHRPHPAASAGGAAPVPDAIRELLPFPLRKAALLALQAEDHYVRVHTDAGSALIRFKMSDALSVLDPAWGFQTHRSWWVAEAAIRDVRWSRGSGIMRLENSLEVPISRAFARSLTSSKRI